jgi:hypothetical protein
MSAFIGWPSVKKVATYFLPSYDVCLQRLDLIMNADGGNDTRFAWGTGGTGGDAIHSSKGDAVTDAQAVIGNPTNRGGGNKD